MSSKKKNKRRSSFQKLDSPSKELKPSRFGPSNPMMFGSLPTDPDQPTNNPGDLTIDTSTTSLPSFLKNNNWLRSTFKSPKYTKLKL
mmetsp:Transcript_8411/g.7472  ORF Transcript_8411/g.7472 Transcript_8411/m.7472 type:complete len:87 (+) Transcript_8411:653-913(+)